MSARMTVFVSYSRQDVRWLDRLRVHLRPLARGDLDLWDDSRIQPGERWREAIAAAIDRAAAAILLVSADFLASDFVAAEELPPLLHKASCDGAIILPIVVQPCLFDSHVELSAFHSVNTPDRPLSQQRDADAEAVFVRVAQQVRRVLAERAARGGAASLPIEPGTNGSAASVNVPLYDQLRGSIVLLHLLAELSHLQPDHGGLTLTELQRVTRVDSRKTALQAAERLALAGWVTKERVGDRTRYCITHEGLRQRQRLMAGADGSLDAAR